MQSWDIFARLAAMLGIHCEILYECSFTEPQTLLRGTQFENHCTILLNTNVLSDFLLFKAHFLSHCCSKEKKRGPSGK